MPRLIVCIFFSLIYFNVSYGNENYSCRWDNETSIPCLEISSLISNSSDFSKSGIKKIIITKKEIEDSGAVDLIDIFKSIPDINITQSGPKGQQA